MSHDRRGAVYGFVCTAGLSPIVVKLSFTRGQLTTWCKPDITLFYPDLCIRVRAVFLRQALSLSLSHTHTHTHVLARDVERSNLSLTVCHTNQSHWAGGKPIYSPGVGILLALFPLPVYK